MPNAYTDVEAIIRAGTESAALDSDAFHAYCHNAKIQFGDACNAVALEVARRFDGGAMRFDEADGVMNALNGLIIGWAVGQENAALPEPAWSIYLAFDAGEYDHRDGKDPVEAYTKPGIKQILATSR